MTPAFHAFLAAARFRRAPADDPDPPAEGISFDSNETKFDSNETKFDEAT
jgi:hypothetical protein